MLEGKRSVFSFFPSLFPSLDGTFLSKPFVFTRVPRFRVSPRHGGAGTFFNSLAPDHQNNFIPLLRRPGISYKSAPRRLPHRKKVHHPEKVMRPSSQCAGAVRGGQALSPPIIYFKIIEFRVSFGPEIISSRSAAGEYLRGGGVYRTLRYIRFSLGNYLRKKEKN